MKPKFRFALTLLFILSISSNIYSQFTSIGIKSGFNLSKLDYKSDLKGYDFSYKTGINAGLLIEYKLSNSLFLHSELIYSMRGTEYGAEGKTISGYLVPNHKFVQRHNYLEIPFFIQYNFPMSYFIKPKVFIGAEYSFLLEAKIGLIEEGIHKWEADEKVYYKRSEYGIILGAGVEYELESDKIVFDIRYNLGLKDINIYEQGSEIKSNTISFNMSFLFSL